MGKLWGGRFSKKEIDPNVLKFTSSLDVDIRLIRYDCISSKVHVEMLAKCGYISGEEKNVLISALEEAIVSIDNGTFDAGNSEDVHTAVQDYVSAKCPEAAKKLHTARSRNEQVVNDVRLYCMDAVKNMTEAAEVLQKSLLALAEQACDIIVPGYTHLNHAQPVLFSHLLTAYMEMIERDKKRLECASAHCDISVMGSGAIAGSALDLDRNFVAEKLGFASVSANSIDSVSDRDFLVEILSALSIIAVHLSRISEDLILYSTNEFGFLDIGEDFCTGSSLMPQKKNPDVLELIRGKSAQVIGALNSELILLKGLPHAYNRDLQEDKKPFFEAVDTVQNGLLIMASLMGTVKLKRTALAVGLNNEFIYATDLAEYLVTKGMPFKEAHNIIGSMIKHCISNGINISDLSVSELTGFSEKLGEDAFRLLDAEISVNNKKTPGSTNPDMVKKEIAKWKKKLRA